MRFVVVCVVVGVDDRDAVVVPVLLGDDVGVVEIDVVCVVVNVDVADEVTVVDGDVVGVESVHSEKVPSSDESSASFKNPTFVEQSLLTFK